VPAAPVPDARATGVERGERAIRLSDGRAAPQLRAEFRGAGVLWTKNEAREKYRSDER
jgi:hypothetical protein